jgi:4'-phosphopantetheinyl transferase
VFPPDSSWPRTIESVALSAGDVHVWRVDLALTPVEQSQRSVCLAPDERERAERFVSEPARVQFVAARSALRTILSRYVGNEPSDIVFQLGPIGKPALGNPGRSNLFFNLSHSRQMALVAVTQCAEIGVDVESIREMASREQLAERFFHPNEVATLTKLPERQRAQGFFNAWTRKEAFLKATGKGISFGIDRVEVTLVPGEVPRVLSIDGSTDAAATWSLEALSPAVEYVGAAAMNGRWKRIQRYSL